MSRAKRKSWTLLPPDGLTELRRVFFFLAYFFFLFHIKLRPSSLEFVLLSTKGGKKEVRRILPHAGQAEIKRITSKKEKVKRISKV
ncbi:MAG: hypothetical protein KBA66_04090 [Leptospiraceae bacterium]|nr:hypothetical protein [Leptospiraceae bacterium]